MLNPKLNVGKNREEYGDSGGRLTRPILKRSLETGSPPLPGARMGYSHEDTQPRGSPDTHRGPHPPDTGHTPGVSEPEEAAEVQRGREISAGGWGLLGTAVAYRPASINTLQAEGSTSGYRCQNKSTPPRNALNRWQMCVTATLCVITHYNPHVCIRLVQ